MFEQPVSAPMYSTVRRNNRLGGQVKLGSAPKQKILNLLSKAGTCKAASSQNSKILGFFRVFCLFTLSSCWHRQYLTQSTTTCMTAPYDTPGIALTRLVQRVRSNSLN